MMLNCAYCDGEPTVVDGSLVAGHRLRSVQCLNIGCPGQRTRFKFGYERSWNARQKWIAREVGKAKSVVIPLLVGARSGLTKHLAK